MLVLIQKFKVLCRKNLFNTTWSRNLILDYNIVLLFLEKLDYFSCGECFKGGAFMLYNETESHC